MEIARLKEELIQQRKSKFKGNIYHYSQVNFAYNSNKIEGGRLSEDETEEIFETDSFIPKSDETIKLDDLIEMKNHFRLFDYTLDTLNDDLSKEMIINMNKILKRNTTDEENPRYNVGGFKIIPNKIKCHHKKIIWFLHNKQPHVMKHRWSKKLLIHLLLKMWKKILVIYY